MLNSHESVYYIQSCLQCVSRWSCIHIYATLPIVPPRHVKDINGDIRYALLR